ncbi:MAG: hypothetical protein E7384_06305 [Ruminococcaceae bacterium]|nr:hypothetical protein [Oscillospiraceae bacterium]
MGDYSTATKKGLNNIQLRTIAMAAMVLLNIAWCGLIKNPFIQLPLGIIGSGSITLFAFLAEEACKNSKNTTKYMLRLLLLSLISAVPYYFVYGDPKAQLLNPSNYFSSPMTIFLCVGSVLMMEKIKGNRLRLFTMVFLCIVSFIFGFEWCPYALVLIFIIHLYSDNIRYRDFYITMFFVTFAVVNAVMYLMGFFRNTAEITQNVSLIGCVWPLYFIRKYDGTMGKSVKILSYAAYPLMLVTILLIKLLLKL